ncbi:MAG: hypothetical protein QG568_337 [Patescibacteria group bacterium]|nr:hypothetical protein [Patescibacteria group bacterium]
MSSTTTKNLAILDIDNTLVKGQSQRHFIEHLYNKGYISTYRYVVIMAWFILYKLHLVKDTAKMLSFALQIFKGKSVDEIDELVNTWIRENKSSLYFKNTKKALQTLRDANFEIVLLSSAVEPIVKSIAQDLRVEEYICTKLGQSDDKLDGQTNGAQVYSDEKLNKIQSFINESKIDYDEILVMADHDSDIPILRWAKKAIVANPQADMKKWASQNNIPVIYLDTDESIQYFESYIVSQ